MINVVAHAVVDSTYKDKIAWFVILISVMASLILPHADVEVLTDSLLLDHPCWGPYQIALFTTFIYTLK